MEFFVLKEGDVKYLDHDIVRFDDDATDALEGIMKDLSIEKNKGEAHNTADDILCRVLIELGFIDLVNDYNKINKPRM